MKQASCYINVSSVLLVKKKKKTLEYYSEKNEEQVLLKCTNIGEEKEKIKIKTDCTSLLSGESFSPFEAKPFQSTLHQTLEPRTAFSPVFL